MRRHTGGSSSLAGGQARATARCLPPCEPHGQYKSRDTGSKGWCAAERTSEPIDRRVASEGDGSRFRLHPRGREQPQNPGYCRRRGLHRTIKFRLPRIEMSACHPVSHRRRCKGLTVIGPRTRARHSMSSLHAPAEMERALSACSIPLGFVEYNVTTSGGTLMVHLWGSVRNQGGWHQ